MKQDAHHKAFGERAFGSFRWFGLFGLLVVMGALAPAFAAEPPSLIQAYKKEYAFLQAQKQALQSRLRTLERQITRRVGASTANLRNMQARLLSIRNRTQQLQQDLQVSTQANAAALSLQESLEKLQDRVRFGLSQKQVNLPKVGEGGNKVSMEVFLQKAFGSAAGLLKQAGQVRKQQGSFFLADGSQTKGTLIHIGGIASYGIGERASGALAPAGAGRLKLWPKPAAATAMALQKGNTPLSVKVFLYETLDKEIAWKPGKTLYAFLQSGGVIGWVIVGLGILALGMVLMRILILWSASANAARLMDQLEPLVQSGQQQKALEICQQTSGALSRVLQKAVSAMHLSRQQREELVVEAVLKESPAIERFGTLIAVCAAVAPLLGLLGTVTGMISTFDVITEFGTGDPKMLAGGISEALVTTQLGLMVAIPCLLIGTLLSGRAEALLGKIEWSALRLMNIADTPTAPVQSEPSTTWPTAHDSSDSNMGHRLVGIAEREAGGVV